MIAPFSASRSVTLELLQIGPGHLVSERKQHLGNAAHADAADAYEMYPLNFCKHWFLSLRSTPLQSLARLADSICACCSGLAAQVGLALCFETMSLRSTPLKSFATLLILLLLMLGAFATQSCSRL